MPSTTDDARMAAMPASASLPRRSFTREDYHAMGRAGILTPEDRVELLDGEVIVMAPIGTRHAAGVDRLTRAFYSAGPIAGRALVRVQNPLAVSHRSELQPDLMLLVQRDDDYAFEHPESRARPDRSLLGASRRRVSHHAPPRPRRVSVAGRASRSDPADRPDRSAPPTCGLIIPE